MNGGFRNATCAVIFALTGVGTAMLGATLPAILLQWHLSDATGGVLLLAAWGGSTTGAVFVRNRPERTAGLGLVLSAAALAALSGVHRAVLVPLYLVYGLGLGLTMTSISVLRSHQVAAAHADVEMNRLNLLWAAGACAAPALALRSLHLLSVAVLFRLFGCALLALAVTMLATSDSRSGPKLQGAPGQSRTPGQLSWAPLRFGLFAAAAVGIESAIGSWLTTYAERVMDGVGTAVSANSAFWAGLLISRAAHSLHSARFAHTRAARVLHLVAVGLALVMLILFPGERAIPAAGLLCGLGLGPLYPYVLSVALPRFRSTAIFALAGVGASLVPWLTGAISSRYGSLRIGLLAPAVAFMFLVGSGIAMRSELMSGASLAPAEP